MKKFLYVVVLNSPEFPTLLEIPFLVDKILDLHNESTFKELFESFKRTFTTAKVFNVCITYVGRVKLASSHDCAFFDLNKE